MLITKYTHACVRLEDGGRVLVIDPGTWSEPEALFGADAILITHEHSDHADVFRLAGAGIPVYAPAGADLADDWGQSTVDRIDLRRVEPGSAFEAAGFSVRTVGERHKQIYGGRPDCPNLGYLIDDSLYHPGDALAVPDQPVETLLIPAQASWLSVPEAIDFALAVKPERSFAIHDAQINERGAGAFSGWLTHVGDFGYRYLRPGDTL